MDKYPPLASENTPYRLERLSHLPKSTLNGESTSYLRKLLIMSPSFQGLFKPTSPDHSATERLLPSRDHLLSFLLSIHSNLEPNNTESRSRQQIYNTLSVCFLFVCLFLRQGLTVQPRLALNLKSSCLCLQSAEI
jgi:hypothetical protein